MTWNPFVTSLCNALPVGFPILRDLRPLHLRVHLLTTGRSKDKGECRAPVG